MKRLENRVAIVTGAGRGVGRSHALALAAEGASVLVNDFGGEQDGEGGDARPADEVVAEIKALGGKAAPNYGDVSSWQDTKDMVDAAVAAFGDLHVIVNNAGIMRDHSIIETSEKDWDMVMDIHVKGHMGLIKWAMTYWDAKFKRGEDPKGSIINTSSIGGVGGLGNANYSTAKEGITMLGLVAGIEGAKIGVRSNTVSPNARTRLTTPRRGAVPPTDPDVFDFGNPDNISPMIVYLAQENCPVNGGVFHVAGNQIGIFKSWSPETIEGKGRWTPAMIEEAMPKLTGGNSQMPSVVLNLERYVALINKAKAAL